MHARGTFALASGLLLIAATLQAAPWERAGSKIQTDNNTNTNTTQSRRSTRAYSYSPTAAAAPTLAQPQAAVQAPMAQRAQTVAPMTVAPRQPATTYTPNQARGYRSYSYQPSYGNGYDDNARTRTRVPFYMRADSKVMGREGVF